MRFNSLFLVTLISGMGLSSIGCADNPADSRPAAVVQGVATANAAQSASDKSGPLNLSGDIIFVGSKVTGNHACKFTDWQGAAVPNGTDIEKMTFSFTVKMDGILADYESPNSWSKKLEGHLKSDDFFGVDSFPTSTFVSTRIERAGKTGSTYTVSGLLTIKGVQKLISFPATIQFENGKLSMLSEFSINRKHFNIEYAGKPDDLIRDDVLLKLAFNH